LAKASYSRVVVTVFARPPGIDHAVRAPRSPTIAPMRIGSWAALVACIIACSACETSASSPGQPATALAASTAGAVPFDNRFAFKLYANLGNVDENLIASPLSAAFALSALADGARGETEAEMVGALDADRSHRAALRRSVPPPTLGPGSIPVLRMSSHLWGHVGTAFRAQYLQGLRDRYDTPFDLIDFRDTERARMTINRWAASSTEGEISELLGPGTLEPSTRLVVTSAVSFKGSWESRFQESMTFDDRFENREGVVTVKTMSQLATFPYATFDGGRVVELPYVGGLSMLILLPDRVDGLRAMASRLVDGYEALRLSMTPQTVCVQIPRWKSSWQGVLNDALRSLGVRRAFDLVQADFSGISSEQLHIDQVVQDATITVDETGTRAAAATAATLSIVSFPPVPIFHANHPFAFVICERASGAVVFLGHVTKPQ
jgi:serpin B